MVKMHSAAVKKQESKQKRRKMPTWQKENVYFPEHADKTSTEEEKSA